jgi:DegV family protein with EDD domain
VIRVITDSSCDLPEHIIERLRIEVVPLTIRFGDEEFVDRAELSADEFWRRLVESDTLSETAAPSVGRFETAYHRVADEGADGIVAICISSAISATHSAAVNAARRFDRVPVHVVDSQLVSAALGLAVVAAAEGADAGKSLDEIGAAADGASGHTNLFAALDTLEYLRRGGRIGGAQAFLGGLLDVKPIITFEDGEVAAAGRVRTRRRAVDAVVAHAAGLGALRRLAVVHSDPPDLDEIVARLEPLAPGELMISRLGPVVGTHAGPGVAGVAYDTA